MRKLAAIFSLMAGLASATDFGSGYDIILFGEQEIAAGETNVIETAYKTLGVLMQAAVFQTGSGESTTTVEAVRGNFSRVIAEVVADNNAATSSVFTIPAYNEAIRFTTINSGTNTISVSPAIFYEK